MPWIWIRMVMMCWGVVVSGYGDGRDGAGGYGAILTGYGDDKK